MCAHHGARLFFSKLEHVSRALQFSSVQKERLYSNCSWIGQKTPLWTGESPTASAATRHPDQLREILTRVPPWAGVGGE